jgi:phosphatidylinositol-3-phosphatase
MGCGGGSGSHGGPPVCTAPAACSTPLTVHVRHVLIVVEENHSYSDVIGNSSMPYLNRLATTYAYAQAYYANTHPSIGNYFMLTTGQIISNDDGFSSEVTADNIVRHLIKAGKTWKEYSEDLPSVGYTGGDSDGYAEHHNPLSYFSDVREDVTQAQNLVPFAQFATDLANHSLPNYSFIVPNNDDNAHDGTLAEADSWLQSNIDPLVQSSDFNTPGGGLLIVVFDESVDSDTADGGGHVAWVVVGPDVKKGFTSTTSYQHESTLRFMSEAIGLTDFPGAAATASNMGEFISGN